MCNPPFIPDLWADEDTAAYLEDLIVYYHRKIDQDTDHNSNIQVQLTEAEWQLKFMRRKIETGDGTCGSGVPIPGCQCEGCRYEYGQFLAPNLKTAIARRPLVEGTGYIHHVRNKVSLRVADLKPAGKAVVVAARISTGATHPDIIFYNFITDPKTNSQLTEMGDILVKLPEEDLDRLLAIILEKEDLNRDRAD